MPKAKASHPPTAEELLSAFVNPEDILMALRYHYYVKARPLVPDHLYDEAEKEWLSRDGTDEFTSPLNEPGSDRADQYSDRVKALALYFSFLQHAEDKRHARQEIKV